MAEGGLLEVNRRSELAGVGLGFPGLVLACFGFFGFFWMCFGFSLVSGCFWSQGHPYQLGLNWTSKTPK
jgi:hypothetical protein